MKRLNSLALLALATLPSLSHAADAPPRDAVTIQSYSYSGSGCPSDTVAPTLSNDNQALTLGFAEFNAEVLPNGPSSQARKQCTITVQLDYPTNFSYAISKVDYRGYAYLDPKVVAQHISSYAFDDRKKPRRYTAKLGNGNKLVDENYLFTDHLPQGQFAFAPCGRSRALVIDTELRVDNSKNRQGQGTLSSDSLDLDLRTEYQLRWKPCR